jgi:hypothetical protein
LTLSLTILDIVTIIFFNGPGGHVRNFLTRQWRYVILLIVSVAWLTVFPVWSKWITRNPLDVAVSMSSPLPIEKTVKLVIRESYELNFAFERAGVTFEKLREVIGKMGLCRTNEVCSKGIVIPISWSLSEAETGAVIAAEKVDSQDSTGWSSASVFRRIGVINVPKGTYIFRASLPSPIMELSSMRVRIVMQLRPKEARSWQMMVVWWGSLGASFAAWPVAVFSGLMLMWHAMRALNYSKRQNK